MMSWPRVLRGSPYCIPGARFPKGPPSTCCLPPPSPQQHAAHSEGAHRGTCLAERRVTGRDSGRQHLPSPNAWQWDRTLTMDQLLSPGWSQLRLCRAGSSLPSYSWSLDLTPGGPHTHFNPVTFPLKPAPQRPPPFWSRGLCPCLCFGQRNNVSREGKWPAPPNLEGEFRRKERSSWG